MPTAFPSHENHFSGHCNYPLSMPLVEEHCLNLDVRKVSSASTVMKLLTMADRRKHVHICRYSWCRYGYTYGTYRGFPFGSDSEEAACSVGYPGLIPGSGRSPGEGNGTPLQYSCLENPMDGGAWRATVHRVTKSRTRLSNFTFT